MKNLLSLHEAIVVALININKETFTATFEDIAAYIEARGLYPERKANVALAIQVMLRSTKAKGAYGYLFHQVDVDTIQLKQRPVAKAIKKKAGRAGTKYGLDFSSYKENKKPIATPGPGEEILRK